MRLANGITLGRYEILAPLGAGGMGEVYRARDTRLERTVAIKVLPAALVGGEEMRERFEREARAVSALTHPHICGLYDIGHQDGTDYLVMEYIEGETLAQRLARGAMPPAQIARYGAEIAQALHAAHRRGITHRDLKPGNIMIAASGAKLLDFGLAKFTTAPVRIFSDASAPATRVEPLTEEGTIVGTYHYMSPEQLEGKPLDHRTDIFSLGVILYEMATGQRPFQGSSAASVMAAIIAAEPTPVSTLQPATPPALDRIITTALEKNPDDRWQTAHDVALQMRWLAESSRPSSASAEAGPTRRRRTLWLGVAIGAAAAGLVAAAGIGLIGKPPAPRRLQLDLAPTAGSQFDNGVEANGFAISPDGGAIAFVAHGEAGTRLYVRRLDAREPQEIEGTDSASAPFWSPDSQWLGFSARGKLWKKRLGDGTPPQAIANVAVAGAVANWGGDTILFSDRPGGRLEIHGVSPAGGVVTRVTRLEKGQWRHLWPQFIDDRHFVYITAFGADRNLMLSSLGDDHSTMLVANVSQVRPAGNDLVMYVRDGKLLVQRLDLAKRALTGDPQLIHNDVAYFHATSRGAFDVSRNGTLVYRTNTGGGRIELRDRGGRTIRTVDDKGPFWDLALSPDGKKAAVSVIALATGMSDLWIYDLERSIRDRFTSAATTELTPVWSPDGRSLIYIRAGESMPRVVHQVLGSETSRPLTDGDMVHTSGGFTPDGSWVYYSRNDPRTRADILRVRTDGQGKPEPVMMSPFSEAHPTVSPDGQWLAFVTDAPGTLEVFVQPVAGGERIRISRDGGTSPRWRSDGRELFFLTRRRTVMSATPSAPGRWQDTVVTPLFTSPEQIQSYSPAPDGQSFLVAESWSGDGDDRFRVQLGWAAQHEN
ncbi:MAG: protein kinase domain-containing protein [Thermoanaerobaculia bacterium]